MQTATRTHQLLIEKIRLKVQNKSRLNPPRYFDINQIPQAYHVQIENRFEVLGQTREVTEPEDLWQKTKEILEGEGEGGDVSLRDKYHDRDFVLISRTHQVV